MVSGTIASIAAGIQVALAGALAFIALRAYHRVKAKRMGMLGLAFLLFLVQGLVLAFGLLSPDLALVSAATGAMALNAAAFLVIYLGVLRP
ncbi:MAG: hypothetical protein R3185_06625 [Candidatus Thermoplasmatota archaeon]|nr:hypothetical protein [Candidatus Thermoplasmatota archaeon]